MQISNEIRSIYNSPQGYPNGIASPSGNDALGYKEPQDKVTLSKKAQDKAKNETSIKDDNNLDSQEKQQVNQLKKRDAEVKAHEAAHMAAGGAVVQGGASYQYERGPDGKMYAVGGEVKIDMSPERTPEATIRKMQQVKAAALAPAQPSGTDRAVAARAAQVEAKARSEKSEGMEETQEGGQSDANAGANRSNRPEEDNDMKAGPLSAYDANTSQGMKPNRALGTLINLSA